MAGCSWMFLDAVGLVHPFCQTLRVHLDCPCEDSQTAGFCCAEYRIESRRAASQFMDAGGPRLILKVLSAQAALSLFRLLRYLDLGS